MQTSGHVVNTPLLTAAAADTSAAELLVQNSGVNYVAGAFQLSGTLTSVVVYFECTVDGTNWVALECVSAGDSGTVATQATAVGVWKFNAIGLYKVRARLDWTSGSVNISGTLIA